MAYIRWHHQSDVLRLQTSLTIALPELNAISGPLPVMYLLHGGTENSTTWLREANIEQVARDYGLLIASIDGLSSAYVDMRHGGKYFTYLTEELPAFLKQHMNVLTDREHTFIAGFSMGGQGALRAAMRRPELYAACFGLSGARDTIPLFEKWSKMENGPDLKGVEDALGPISELRGSENDIVFLAEQAAKSEKEQPEYYIACAEDDYAAALTDAYDAQLTEFGLRHKYYKGRGIHNYVFAEEALRWSLDDFLGKRGERA